jgi:hypothetical protein
MPFLYFSSGKVRNNYNMYGTTDCPNNPLPVLPIAGMPAGGIWPYARVFDGPGAATNDYYNPQTFQIISAGRNKRFGRGSAASGVTWSASASNLSPALHSSGTTNDGAGKDDQSNFHPRLLGN